MPSVVGPDGATDGLPTVIIEAFAKGVPVVGTRTAAIPEIVKNWLTGYLVLPDSPEQLAFSMGELLERRELRDQFAIEARRLVEREYDLERSGRLLAMLMSTDSQKSGQAPAFPKSISFSAQVCGRFQRISVIVQASAGAWRISYPSQNFNIFVMCQDRDADARR